MINSVKKMQNKEKKRLKCVPEAPLKVYCSRRYICAANNHKQVMDQFQVDIN